MKIGVLFSGQPRCIDKCLPYWKENLFDQYDTTHYMHCWWDYTKIGQRYRTSRNEFQAIVLSDTLKILAEDYKLKQHLYLQTPISFPTDFKSTIQPNDPGFIFAIQSMWYSRFKVWQLFRGCDHLESYDWIIVSRIDLTFFEKLHFNLDPEYIHTYHDCKHTDYCLNDHFAIMKPDLIKYYCGLYVEIYRLYAEGVPYCSETFLGAFLKEQQIKSKHYNIKYKQAEYT
jgi:hypothetical protein